MDKTVFLGRTIDSRLKDSHGQCETLSSETLALYCWLVCVINKKHSNADPEWFSWSLLLCDWI